jgi:hypothetical protein
MPGIKTKSTRTGEVSSGPTGLAIVSLSDGQHSYGLYRVKNVDTRTMEIAHGAFSFPVGLQLDVEDFKYRVPNPNTFRQRATVVENRSDGMRLVW